MKEKKVINYYNSFSNDYNSFYRRIQFSKYENTLPSEFRVLEWTLDHGGGTGLLSEWFRYPLLTLDISIRMLRRGIKNNHNHLGIAGDMNHLPFRNNSFSQILSFTALQNSSDVSVALKEIWRVSENGSTQILTYLNKSFPKNLFSIWENRYQIEIKDLKFVVEDKVIFSKVYKSH